MLYDFYFHHFEYVNRNLCTVPFCLLNNNVVANAIFMIIFLIDCIIFGNLWFVILINFELFVSFSIINGCFCNCIIIWLFESFQVLYMLNFGSNE